MKTGDVITLTSQELYIASLVGMQRRVESLKHNSVERYGAGKQSVAEQWFINMQGAQAEMAFAKGACLYWPASLNAPRSEPDVDPHWQVRCGSLPSHELYVDPNMPEKSDWQKFAFLTGTGPQFIFHGWIFGIEAKKCRCYSKGGGEVHWVPQAFLQSST